MRRAIIRRAYSEEITVIDNLPDDVDDAIEIVESDMSNADEFWLLEQDIKITHKRYDEKTDSIQ